LAAVPGLRVQFDPMPDETVERLGHLLKDLGLEPEARPGPAPPPVATPPPASPSAPFGPPFIPADVQQITWAQPEGLDTTRAMSEEAVRTALEAADRTPAPAEPPASREVAQAALAPPPVMPVSTPAPAIPPPSTATPPPTRPLPEMAAGDPRLMVQIRGLLMELGEVQTRVDVKERETSDLVAELERLRAENRDLKERLARAEEQLRNRDLKDRSGPL
ncbi:MAG TPA: hypothetical protein VND93_31500, partial [Myxococcales bacterium]|nr:hypothetical protein [Myxococcales bacterium]